MSRNIMIDIDGVMADFCSSFTALAKELGLIDYTISTAEQPEWAFPFQVSKVWEVIDKTPNWWMRLKQLHNTSEAQQINAIMKRDNVYFITNRTTVPGCGLSAAAQTRHWLFNHGINADAAAGVIATGSGTKGKLCRALDIDLAIEDKPENLRDIDRDSNALPVARGWKYNEGLRFARVESLSEFIEKYITS